MSIMGLKKHFGISGLMAGFLVLLAVACGRSGEDQATPAADITPPETAAPVVPDRFSGWLEYGSDLHGFSIFTPKSFDVSRDTTQTAAGEIELTTYLAEMGQAAYGVVCNDFPTELVEGKDPNILLKGGSQGFVGQFAGIVTGERLLTLDGHTGLEVALTGATQGVDIFAKGRFYLVGLRMYQVTVIAEKGSEDLEAIDRFLGSFRLK